MLLLKTVLMFRAGFLEVCAVVWNAAELIEFSKEAFVLRPFIIVD